MTALHELVSRRAALDPSALAVRGADELTYGELDTMANRVARGLQRSGVQPGDRVVVWLEKSPRTLAVLQGVLRCGAAYVPLDPGSPAGRVATMTADCAPRVVVTTGERAQALRRAGVSGVRWLYTDDDVLDDDVGVVWSAVTAFSAAEVAASVGEDDLAYILYTSGSTGVPKGVCVSHRNALAFIGWAAQRLDATSQDRFSNHAPLHFDLSVLDMYVAFLVGASVHLVPSGMAYSPGLLVDFLHREQITVWYSVPSVLLLMQRYAELLEKRPPKLRCVLFAGEPFPIKPLRRMIHGWPGIRFLNLYGPTETNVCTAHEVDTPDLDRDVPVPIGRACSGDQVWAEREDGQVAACGEEGELVVDGPTVMLGYWGKPPQRGPYRTGDQVRVLPDGMFDYRGRLDRMVKLRGNRVELGDIEAALLAHPNIEEVAAVVAGESIDAKLVVYAVAADGAEPSLLELKRHCAARIPASMIPDEVRYLDVLPRTVNGKTDKRQLATLDATR